MLKLRASVIPGYEESLLHCRMLNISYLMMDFHALACDGASTIVILWNDWNRVSSEPIVESPTAARRPLQPPLARVLWCSKMVDEDRKNVFLRSYR